MTPSDDNHTPADARPDGSRAAPEKFGPTWDALFGAGVSETLDSPRYQGLYRALGTVTIPPQGLAATTKGSLADLDHLYPKELGYALNDRQDMMTELRDILAEPETEWDLPRKARLEAEILKIERRLFLHNRRTREAHHGLAETLGGEWPDLLTSLSRALNYVERLKVGLSTAVAWSNKEIKLDPNLVRAEVDSTLGYLRDFATNLGVPLAGLARKIASAREQAAPGPGQAEGLSLSRDAGPEPAEAGAAEALLLAELGKFPDKRPKGRRDLARETLSLAGTLERLRLFFLSRLLEAEETVFSWRGLDEAPIQAPAAVSVPDPPPLAHKARLEAKAAVRGPLRFTMRFRRWFVLFSLFLVAIIMIVWLDKNQMGKPGVIYVYNGLSAQVTVMVGDIKHPVPSGAALPINRPRGEFTITANSDESFIEFLEDIPEQESGEGLVYNVAGSSPLFEWEAIYSLEKPDGPPPEKRLGAPRLLLTEAEFVLTDPPKSAKVSAEDNSKLVLSALSGVHPARMLDLLDPADRVPVIEAQARWNRPGSLWAPLWLDLLANNSPKAAGILLARVGDFPRDPWTLGYLLKILGPKNLVGLCLELESQTTNPDDPDLAYLASLCLSPVERSTRLGELLKLWPNQPWLNRAAGWQLFARDDLDGALWYLDQAFEHDPTTLLPELEILARLRHLHGLPPSSLAEEFNFWVPGLAPLINREAAGQGDAPRPLAQPRAPGPNLSPQDRAYFLLEQGRLAEALASVGPGPLRDRLTRLAGASESATEEMVEAALALPADRGLDRDTAWPMLGLAVKRGRPTDAYLTVIAETSPKPGTLLAQSVIDRKPRNLEYLVTGRDAWLQGQACVAAEIAGLNVPPKCPPKARGFLFVGEKPYLTPLPPVDHPEPLPPGPPPSASPQANGAGASPPDGDQP
ncbi:MAG: hypothetical protein LBF58_01400 [Deltaproteobacteria bacterium]|jgi:hypothetical protein|nr:hypothetical protein [Deltaproteobacteria bacterium]